MGLIQGSGSNSMATNGKRSRRDTEVVPVTTVAILCLNVAVINKIGSFSVQPRLPSYGGIVVCCGGSSIVVGRLTFAVPSRRVFAQLVQVFYPRSLSTLERLPLELVAFLDAYKTICGVTCRVVASSGWRPVVVRNHVSSRLLPQDR